MSAAAAEPEHSPLVLEEAGSATPEAGRRAGCRCCASPACFAGAGGCLALYALCIAPLASLSHALPDVGLPLLTVVPPLVPLLFYSVRHRDGLDPCQLFLTACCSVLWMTPLILAQYAMAAWDAPQALYTLDPVCARCYEEPAATSAEAAAGCACWGKTLAQAVALSAIPEEIVKLLAVIGVANRTEIRRPTALVLYAMGAAAGFAAVENALYIHAQPRDDVAVAMAVARASLCIPLHMVCGALIGVLLARRVWLYPPSDPESGRLWSPLPDADESRRGPRAFWSVRNHHTAAAAHRR